MDANDTIYQFDASGNHDPSAALEKITAPVPSIKSADDFVNPPGLGIAECEAPRLKQGRFILLPISANTFGHVTQSPAPAWKSYLTEFMQQTEPSGPSVP